MSRTDKQIASEVRFREQLDKDLAAWVGAQIEAGESWDLISRELYRVTDGEVNVSSVTLAKWYGDREAVA